MRRNEHLYKVCFQFGLSEGSYSFWQNTMLHWCKKKNILHRSFCSEADQETAGRLTSFIELDILANTSEQITMPISGKIYGFPHYHPKGFVNWYKKLLFSILSLCIRSKHKTRILITSHGWRLERCTMWRWRTAPLWIGCGFVPSAQIPLHEPSQSLRSYWNSCVEMIIRIWTALKTWKSTTYVW